MQKYILILPTLALIGCVSSPTYYKANLNQQQFAADQAFCNAQAQPFSSGGILGLASFMQQKKMCMAGKGYTELTQ